MSALPPKADIAECEWHIRFVPKADIRRASFNRVVGAGQQLRRHPTGRRGTDNLIQ
jgi:hypothetical protein